ncbi:Spermidine/putrescine-binding periplasmic protein precursor [Acholeplasma oculi]|uniref:Spermidine/Putrescine ABC transport, periplasmic-binding protein PotD n=1 Tax=Acholeplasma oculi TaxID=35623 RepID=A0A061AGM5_9MOLU|nr:ABC transporter substrate-binding protein [Acholeplasma oculi]CDR30691.1 Spermidine/Putrescine ABC transport, periplasmic-binding protein PotD [Acholeplasma oculi]SKC34667.1 spermidine/putrescine transport system substrate-binding protein [Acholeplasma oculi]SUT89502.1 Spermidine/putrescine-binding periplasmic protein precursor [Acholeplasma oculi]
MKKVYTALFILAAVFILNACGSNELVIYMPKEYISEDVVMAFEAEKGIKVSLRYFDSNEVLLTNAKVNSYDLIIPSDYAIEELATEGFLKKLDWEKIDFESSEMNESLVTTLNQLESDGFDFLEYSMPYFWGTVGLIYNNTIEGLESDVETLEWAILNESKYSKMIYDSSRDAFMAGLYANDLRMANPTQTNINTAKDFLIDANSKSNASIKSDEILTEAIGGQTPYDVAMVYSGDAVYILQETDNYSFYVPEWSNVWIDGFVIPNNTKHEDWAYEFINFMSSYEASLENTYAMGYTPVRQDVLEELLADEEFAWDDRISYAFTVPVVNFEFYRYNATLKSMIDDAWELVILSN